MKLEYNFYSRREKNCREKWRATFSTNILPLWKTPLYADQNNIFPLREHEPNCNQRHNSGLPWISEWGWEEGKSNYSGNLTDQKNKCSDKWLSLFKMQ